MGLSNQHGHLVLATGNKSELAVGYSTIYGDAVGGFAPIKDVPKTLVWRAGALAQRGRRGARRDAADPARTSISKPPSAELRPGQLDTDSLPPYDVLDDVLDDYVERDRGPRRAGRGGLRRRAGRAGDPAGRHGRVQAPAVPAGPEDLAARPSAATAGCPSPTAGARSCPRRSRAAGELGLPLALVPGACPEGGWACSSTRSSGSMRVRRSRSSRRTAKRFGSAAAATAS